MRAAGKTSKVGKRNEWLKSEVLCLSDPHGGKTRGGISEPSGRYPQLSTNPAVQRCNPSVCLVQTLDPLALWLHHQLPARHLLRCV